MPLPKPIHDALVALLNEWSIRSLPQGAVWVWVQSTLGLPSFDSMVLPDVAWMQRRDYSQSRPLPEDVFLVIEVSDSTLSRDRNLKVSLYAQAGIADYWIVNVAARTLEIHRDPEGDNYRSVQILRAGGEARPLAFPDVVLPVSRLFPE